MNIGFGLGIVKRRWRGVVGGDVTPPAVPTLGATAGASSIVLVASHASPGDVAYYRFKRSSTSGGVLATIATQVSNTYDNNSDVTPGTTYYYKVSAIDDAGNESANSAESSAATPAADTTAPAAPALVSTADTNSVTLVASHAAPADVANYRFKRSTTGIGAYGTLITKSTGTHDDVSAVLGTLYYYKVTVLDTLGNESIDSNITRETVSSTTLKSPTKYGHFYLPPTDGTTNAQLASLAKFAIFNKGQASYAATMRTNGFVGDILQYIVAAEAQGPNGMTTSAVTCPSGFDPLGNQVADEIDDFKNFVHPNESWFLHRASDGQRLYAAGGTGNSYYHMDPGSQGWRDYAVAQMLSDYQTFGFQGIFLDNVEMTTYKAANQLPNSDGLIANGGNGSNGLIAEYSTGTEAQRDAAFKAAWVGYLAQLSTAIRSIGGKVWGNMISDPNSGSSWNDYLANMDGGMNESFATGYSGMTSANWLKNIQQAEATLASGKGFLAVGRGAQADTTKQTFALASYLLVETSGDAYFRYAGTTDNDYLAAWQFSNYSAALGNPTSGRYAVGVTWRRDFEGGYVIVDPTTAAQTGQITVNSLASAVDLVAPLTFETAITGADGFTSNTGTVTRNTTSPLVGTADASVTLATSYGAKTTFTAAPEIYATMLVRYSVFPVDAVPAPTEHRLLQFRAGGATVGNISLKPAGGGYVFALRNGTTTLVNDTTQILLNTTYRIALRQKVGTGANAELEFWVVAGNNDLGASKGVVTNQANIVNVDGVRAGNTDAIASSVRIDNLQLTTGGLPSPL